MKRSLILAVLFLAGCGSDGWVSVQNNDGTERAVVSHCSNGKCWRTRDTHEYMDASGALSTVPVPAPESDPTTAGELIPPPRDAK